jgi:hypothetical protein
MPVVNPPPARPWQPGDPQSFVCVTRA